MSVKNNAAPTVSEGEFFVTRTFDAPRERVFKALTETDQLAKWWGPKGFTMLLAKLDLRPGGSFHYCMEGPAGSPMKGKLWGRFAYREIVAPERIVFVNSFSDEQGGITRHPLAPTWPREVLNTLTLEEEGDKTILRLRGAPINASDEERATFDGAHASMQQGFGGTFDQLTEFLKQP